MARIPLCSFAMTMMPSRAEDVNQKSREVSASLPCVDCFHWVLIDIPATARVIEAGSHSDRVTPRGNPGPVAPYGLRHGINDYTSWGSTMAWSLPFPGAERLLPCPTDIPLPHAQLGNLPFS